MSIASEVLREYGAAIRGDWSDVDGRTVRDDLERIAIEVDNPVYTIEALRGSLGLCPRGGGHWNYWCDNHHEED